jgi:hypothetical protein
MKTSVGEGKDLFITYVCREKKKKKICINGKWKKKKRINVPFPDDLGGCFEVKA